MRLLTIIVTWNVSTLLAKQLECIRKWGRDSTDILVADNSDMPEHSDKLKALAASENVKYSKIGPAGYDSSGKFVTEGTMLCRLNPSDSHGRAIDHAVALAIVEGYDYILLLDHDIFPVLTYSVAQWLGEYHDFAGIKQTREIDGVTKTYLWPGFLAAKTTLLRGIFFMPSPGLDTGGQLSAIIGEGRCVFFEEKYGDHGESLVNGWIHFRNASNWKADPLNDDRIKILLEGM